MIHVGTFDPDATRSGMFLDTGHQDLNPAARRSVSPPSGGIGTPPPEEPSAAEDDPSPPPRSPPCSDDEQEQHSQAHSKDSDESDSSSSSSTSSSIRPQIAVPRAQPEQAQAFAHPKGKVHLRATAEATRFKCGRMITSVFLPVNADSYMRSALCGQCEPAAFPIKTTSDMLAALDAALQRRHA